MSGRENLGHWARSSSSPRGVCPRGRWTRSGKGATLAPQAAGPATELPSTAASPGRKGRRGILYGEAVPGRGPSRAPDVGSPGRPAQQGPRGRGRGCAVSWEGLRLGALLASTRTTSQRILPLPGRPDLAAASCRAGLCGHLSSDSVSCGVNAWTPGCGAYTTPVQGGQVNACRGRKWLKRRAAPGPAARQRTGRGRGARGHVAGERQACALPDRARVRSAMDTEARTRHSGATRALHASSSSRPR